MRSSPYYLFLQGAASRLALQYGQVAVPIGRIAFDYGIHIERSKNLAKFKAQMVVPNCCDDWVRVILPEGNRHIGTEGPSNYDRFCVAHELAHLLLFREFGTQPIDQSSYWKHEYLCDEFARRLLIPDSFIRQIDERELDINALQRASDTVKVPIMHVARRVTQAIPHTTFFQFQKRKSDGWKITSSSLDLAKGTGTSVRNILAINIDVFSQSDLTNKTWFVDGSTLRRSSLEHFDPEKFYKLNATRHRMDSQVVIMSVTDGGNISDFTHDVVISNPDSSSDLIQNAFEF